MTGTWDPAAEGNAGNDRISFGDIVGAARRQIWLVLFVTAACMVAAYGVTKLQTPVYQGNLSIVAGTNGVTTGAALASTGATQTLSSLIRSDVVSGTVVRSLKLGVAPNELAKKITVTVKPESAVLDVGLKWNDKEAVEPILNKIGTVFTNLVTRNLQGGSRSSQPVAFVRIFSPAHVDDKAVSPRPVRTVGLAGLLGLILGILLAVVRERTDERVRSQRDAESDFGATVVGAVPRSSRGANRAEALTLLRINVELMLLRLSEIDASNASILVTYPLRTPPPDDAYAKDIVGTLEGEFGSVVPGGRTSPYIARQLSVRSTSLLDSISTGLIHESDLVLIVARKGSTKRKAARATGTMIQQLGIRNLAIVLTDSDEVITSRPEPVVADAPVRAVAPHR